MARDIMLTADEYIALRRLIESERESEGAVEAAAPKKKRKVSKYQREFGRQLSKLDSMKRLKDGSYRNGWNRSKILAKAHKETRKALGMK